MTNFRWNIAFLPLFITLGCGSHGKTAALDMKGKSREKAPSGPDLTGAWSLPAPDESAGNSKAVGRNASCRPAVFFERNRFFVVALCRTPNRELAHVLESGTFITSPDGIVRFGAIHSCNVKFDVNNNSSHGTVDAENTQLHLRAGSLKTYVRQDLPDFSNISFGCLAVGAPSRFTIERAHGPVKAKRGENDFLIDPSVVGLEDELLIAGKAVLDSEAPPPPEPAKP